MKDPRLLLLIAFVGAVGCASTSSAPKQERVDAHASLEAAGKLQQYTATPEIQAHLARARADIRRGDELMLQKKYNVARLYFERAASESDVAIAWAHAREAEQLASNAGAPKEESHEPDAD